MCHTMRFVRGGTCRGGGSGIQELSVLSAHFSVDLILQWSIKFYWFKCKPRDQLPIQAGFEESKWTAKAGRGQGQSRMNRLTSRRPSLWLFGKLPFLFLREEILRSSVTVTQSSLAALRVLKVLTFLLQLAKLLDSSSCPEKATTTTKSRTCLWQRPSMYRWGSNAFSWAHFCPDDMVPL